MVLKVFCLPLPLPSCFLGSVSLSNTRNRGSSRASQAQTLKSERLGENGRRWRLGKESWLPGRADKLAAVET